MGVMSLGLVGGLIGGLLGAAVMSAGHALMTTDRGGDEQAEDSTVKTADRLSRMTRGRGLSEGEKPMAAQLVHYGFGGAMGATYGVAATVWPAVTIGAGSAFGAAVWLGAHAIVVPALGLSRSPLREPPVKEMRELLLHLAYGVTVGLVWKAVTRFTAPGIRPTPSRRS